jgi:hypothetical protein
MRVSDVATFERNFRQGAPHAGERPDRSPGRSASAAGKRSEAVATDGVREGEVHAPNATTWKLWLGRSKAGCRSVCGQSHALESPVPGEHVGESHATSASARMHWPVRSEAGRRSVAG